MREKMSDESAVHLFGMCRQRGENLKKRGDPFLGGKAEKISEVIHAIVREDIAKEDNEK